MKRRTPLQVLWKSVKVVSCANGEMRVTAKWNPPVTEYTPEDGGGPGLFTRMRAARQLQELIARHLKGRP